MLLSITSNHLDNFRKSFDSNDWVNYKAHICYSGFQVKLARTLRHDSNLEYYSWSPMDQHFDLFEKCDEDS